MASLATAVVLLLSVAVVGGPTSELHAASSKPNILFVLTDDLDLGEMAQMPTVHRLLAEHGATFEKYFVSVSLCCPSRATTLRGQYAHNTGVETNGGINGGFATAYRTGIESSTVATWLQRAGYRTALIGKYLNGYPNTANVRYIPPGWDEWDSSVEGNPYSEYDYTLNENGNLVHYRDRPQDYGTTVYLRKAEDFMTRAARDDQPFFTYLAVYAPHGPATPAPEDVNAFPGAVAPRPPSYNETDVSDKPAWVRAKPLLTPEQQAKIDVHYRKRIESLQAVDRGIGHLIATLKRTGQLSNTYVVFASDNGFHLGNHRLLQGKQTAYEEDVHVPLIVRGPGVPEDVRRDQLTGNVDLAPTFAALAGAPTPGFVDGRSLAPMLHAKPPEWPRRDYLLEHFTQKGKEPPGRGPQEPPDDDTDAHSAASEARAEGLPELRGLRTDRYTYVELATGEQELYDHDHDPYELDNLASTASPELLTRLHDRLAVLEHCRAAACRTADR
jgi:arylsulfatase A-like enzyme